MNVLLVVGGHGFDREPFLDIFREFTEFTEVEYPDAENYFKEDTAKVFDAYVFFDHNQQMSPDAKRDFVDRLEEGRGCLFLHHAIYNHRDWPEFKNILGGCWDFSAFTVAGDTYGPSQYAYDQEIAVHVVDRDHPVTRGVADFELIDETYKDFYVARKVQALLTTDHPRADRTLGWAHHYQKARIVYLQPGDSPAAFGHASFRQLIRQAVGWVAGIS